MTAATFVILALSIISLPIVSSVPVNKGKGRTVEIAYGTAVDYAIAKSSYPFMARIILDGSFKCGGALISDRFVATARHCLEFCPCFNEANPSNDWTRCNDCLVKLRENSDFISDTETVHIIKTIHLPENSGNPYETRGQRTDFALIELAEGANTCTQEETAQGRCWPVTPVRLTDPSIHNKEGQRVRTLDLDTEDKETEVVCKTEYDKVCRTETKRVCQPTARQKCRTVNDQQCHTVPKEVCVEQPKTDYEPYRDIECSTQFKDDCEYQWEGHGKNKVWASIAGTCKINPYETCKNVTKYNKKQVSENVCRIIDEEQCVDVPQQECVAVPDQICTNQPLEKCQNVPRQNCQAGVLFG